MFKIQDGSSIWVPNWHAHFELQSPLLPQVGLELGPKRFEQMRGLELGSAALAPGKKRSADLSGP